MKNLSNFPITDLEKNTKNLKEFDVCASSLYFDCDCDDAYNEDYKDNLEKYLEELDY